MYLLGILVLVVTFLIARAAIKRNRVLEAPIAPTQLDTTNYSDEELAAAMAEVEGDRDRWKALESKSAS